MIPKRILIVDNEPAITRSLKLSLETRAGYDVRTENDPTQALNVAREFHPELILMDVLMPNLDGCEAAESIHAEPELSATPIVFLTALAKNNETGGHAVTAGATVYLAKPVDAGELIRCIEQILSQPTLPHSPNRPIPYEKETVDSDRAPLQHTHPAGR